MSRNDGILYSGTTSASLVSPKQKELTDKHEDEAQERKKKRLELAPFAQIVHSELQKEIDDLRIIDYGKLEDNLKDEGFKLEMLANKKAYERLKAVQQRMANILRSPK